jgi:hypothetical protein
LQKVPREAANCLVEKQCVYAFDPHSPLSPIPASAPSIMASATPAQKPDLRFMHLYSPATPRSNLTHFLLANSFLSLPRVQ